MGLIDKMKAAWTKLSGFGNDTPPAASAPLTKPGKVLRYSHISKPISEAVQLAVKLDLPDLAASLLRKEKGITLYTPEGSVKREADSLSTKLGFNNKQRRKLRGQMVRRLNELQAAA